MDPKLVAIQWETEEYASIHLVAAIRPTVVKNEILAALQGTLI